MKNGINFNVYRLTYMHVNMPFLLIYVGIESFLHFFLTGTMSLKTTACLPYAYSMSPCGSTVQFFIYTM